MLGRSCKYMDLGRGKSVLGSTNGRYTYILFVIEHNGKYIIGDRIFLILYHITEDDFSVITERNCLTSSTSKWTAHSRSEALDKCLRDVTCIGFYQFGGQGNIYQCKNPIQLKPSSASKVYVKNSKLTQLSHPSFSKS